MERTEWIKMRATGPEKAKVAEMARAKGLSVSDLLRELLGLELTEAQPVAKRVGQERIAQAVLDSMPEPEEPSVDEEVEALAERIASTEEVPVEEAREKARDRLAVPA